MTPKADVGVSEGEPKDAIGASDQIPARLDVAPASASPGDATVPGEHEVQEDALRVSPEYQGPLEGDALMAALRRQVEYYFSRENLANDAYLVQHMNSQMYVPIAVIAGFNNVRNLTSDVGVLLEALKGSSAVMVDESGTMVKPNISMSRNTLVLREISSDTTEEDIRAVFDAEGCPALESVKADINDTWFVSFADESQCVDAHMFIRDKTLKGRPIKARVKSENLLRSFYRPGDAATAPGAGAVPPPLMVAGSGSSAASTQPGQAQLSSPPNGYASGSQPYYLGPGVPSPSMPYGFMDQDAWNMGPQAGAGGMIYGGYPDTAMYSGEAGALVAFGDSAGVVPYGNSGGRSQGRGGKGGRGNGAMQGGGNRGQAHAYGGAQQAVHGGPVPNGLMEGYMAGAMAEGTVTKKKGKKSKQEKALAASARADAQQAAREAGAAGPSRSGPDSDSAAFSLGNFPPLPLAASKVQRSANGFYQYGEGDLLGVLNTLQPELRTRPSDLPPHGANPAECSITTKESPLLPELLQEQMQLTPCASTSGASQQPSYLRTAGDDDTHEEEQSMRMHGKPAEVHVDTTPTTPAEADGAESALSAASTAKSQPVDDAAAPNLPHPDGYSAHLWRPATQATTVPPLAASPFRRAPSAAAAVPGSAPLALPAPVASTDMPMPAASRRMVAALSPARATGRPSGSDAIDTSSPQALAEAASATPAPSAQIVQVQPASCDQRRSTQEDSSRHHAPARYAPASSQVTDTRSRAGEQIAAADELRSPAGKAAFSWAAMVQKGAVPHSTSSNSHVASQVVVGD